MAKHWMAKAFGSHPGKLHRALHVKIGKKIPASKLHAAAKRKGVVGREARAAMTARKIAARRRSSY